MKPVIKNIILISYIPASLLDDLTVIPGEGVLLKWWRPFKKLPLSGLAQCSVTSKTENKTTLYTTAVSGFLYDHFSKGENPLCFLITCADNTRYLIGNSEHPFPVIEISDSFPDKITDKSGCAFTIEFTDNLGLMRVLD